jgi:hypothetical protein
MCGKVTAPNNTITPMYTSNWSSQSITSLNLLCTFKLMYSPSCTPTEANPEQETNRTRQCRRWCSNGDVYEQKIYVKIPSFYRLLRRPQIKATL